MNLRRLTPLLLAIGMAYFPSAQYQVSVLDGPDTEFYGFPVPWNSRFIAGSLAKDIYILPLVMDVIFFLLLAWWFWRGLVPRVSRMPSLARNAIVGGIWIYGVCSAGAIFLTLAVYDLFPSFWYDLPVGKVLGIKVHGSV